MSARTRTASHRYPPPPAPVPGARQSPPLVGIQLYAKTIHPALPSDRYDANIMHRVVPPTLQEMTVMRDASSCDIAATFSLPVAYVAAHWLTSRSPMELPGYENAVVHHINPATEITLRRQPLSPAELASYRELAVSVSRKLDAYVVPDTATVRKPARPSRALLEKLHAEAVAAIGDANASSSSSVTSVPASATDPVHQPADPFVPPRRVKERCGFATTATHPDLALAPDRKSVTKQCKGLYRCARSSAPLNAGWNWYVEFHVVRNAGRGGMCVGLSSADAPLNRLVGTSHASVGFHSSGQVVMRRGEWIPYGRAFGEGDTVGMLVEMPAEGSSDVSSAESLSAPCGRDSEKTNETTNRSGTPSSPSSGTPRVTFFINGQSQGAVPCADDVFEMDDQDGALLLHATACLYREGSWVQLRCCATEWQYFPSASAVCSALRATCHGRAGRAAPGSSISRVRERFEMQSNGATTKAYGGWDSVLTP